MEESSMIHKLSLMLTGLISNQKKYPDEVYLYGIELFISTLISTSLIIILSLIYGCFAEGIIYLSVLTVIRLFAGGHHAETYLQCNILSVSSYFLSLTVYRHIVLRLNALLPYITVISALFVITIILLFAPADNKYKPVQKEDRPKFKIKALIAVCIVFCFCFAIVFRNGISHDIYCCCSDGS